MAKIKRLTRREFVANSMAALGATSLLMATGNACAENSRVTVQQVIDLILKSIPNAPFKKTVDTLKSGKPDQIVTGVITTMFATIPVIHKAIEQKANLIIAHEPTFYNHLDETVWLEKDPVYEFKQKLLAENNIAIWRFHDYWHSHKPDGVQIGVLKAMGWERYFNPESPRMITIPSTTVENVIDLLKKNLGIKNLRFIGDPAQRCERIAVLPGAPGGHGQIQILQKEKPDVMICGELQEWETSEYVRDARAMGVNLSLIVTGHAASEEPGMEWLVQWLQPQLPEVAITHVPSESPFTWR